MSGGWVCEEPARHRKRKAQREKRSGNNSRSVALIRWLRAERAGQQNEGRARCRALAPSAVNARSLKFEAAMPVALSRSLDSRHAPLFATSAASRSQTFCRAPAALTRDSGTRGLAAPCSAAKLHPFPQPMCKAHVWLRLVSLTPAKHVDWEHQLVEQPEGGSGSGPAVRSEPYPQRLTARLPHKKLSNLSAGAVVSVIAVPACKISRRSEPLSSTSVTLFATAERKRATLGLS